MRSMFGWIWAIELIWWCGCAPSPEHDPAPRADADADADSDVDSDADADTDADTDSDGELIFQGAATAQRQQYDPFDPQSDGEIDCDRDFLLTGTAYTGACADCDFAFALDLERIADHSTGEGCDTRPLLAPDLLPGQSLLAFSSLYGEYSEVLWFGQELGGLPSWQAVAYTTSGGSLNSVSVEGDTLSWDVELVYRAPYFRDACDPETFSANYDGGYATARYDSEHTATGAIDCDGGAIDVWTLSSVADGRATVSVDTVSGNTAFDPWVWINDGSGCVVHQADDSFECTFPPPEYRCPSLALPTDGREYQIVVGSFGNCASETAAYQLMVRVDEAGSDPGLVLVHDDHPAADYEFIRSFGSGRISTAGR